MDDNASASPRQTYMTINGGGGLRKKYIVKINKQELNPTHRYLFDVLYLDIFMTQYEI